MDIFGKLANKIRSRWEKVVASLKDYFKKLLFPLYLFPIKLITYSAFYIVKFILKLIFALFGLIWDCLKYPFKSLKNFLKAIVIVIVGIYLIASLFVIVDYLEKQYGFAGEFICSFSAKDKLQSSVVRVVGEYSEGSGFFIADNEVLTNFHVVDGEPSPKIIFPDGKFVTPVRILGNKDADLAVLFTSDKYPKLINMLPGELHMADNEPVLSTGYPLGTDLTGRATVVKGNFVDIRKQTQSPVNYIQTNLSLVPGMSGGPLTDVCGNVLGINTQSMAGLSLFIIGVDAKNLVPGFTDQDITKIQVDPSKSPEDAVVAFYTYLKVRRMQDGFSLLSKEYLQKTNFTEWTNRFQNILDVDIIKTEKYQNTNDTVHIKFSTKNWVDGNAELHYYEGNWQTIKEDGVYKMLKSHISEVSNPDTSWFYE